MAKLRIGLIGTGYWAREVHAEGVRQHPRADLVGVWGRDPARASHLAADLETRAYAKIDALLDDVEALTFAVPPDVQSEIALRAAERGRHVLLEKPIATSPADALRLERVVTQAGVASIVFFTRRFVPEFVDWLQQTSARADWQCGRVEFASDALKSDTPFAASAWRHEKGALWDVGPHALSILWPLLGDVTQVVAGAGVGDQVHLVMRHATGASSTASLSLMVPAAATGSTMYVYGPGGRASPADGALGLPRVIQAHQAATDALITQIEQPGTGHPCDVHFGARVVQVLAAAEQSLVSGCLVHVPSGTPPRQS